MKLRRKSKIMEKSYNQIYCERFYAQYYNVSITGNGSLSLKSQAKKEIKFRTIIRKLCEENDLIGLLDSLDAPINAYINLDIIGSSSMSAAQTIHRGLYSYTVYVEGYNKTNIKKPTYVGCMSYPKWEDMPVCEEVRKITVNIH